MHEQPFLFVSQRPLFRSFSHHRGLLSHFLQIRGFFRCRGSAPRFLQKYVSLTPTHRWLSVVCVAMVLGRPLSLSLTALFYGFGVGFIDGGRKIRSGALRFIPRLRHPLTIPIFFERLALRASVSLSFSVFDSLLSGSKLQASSLVAVRWRGDIMERKSIN